MNHRPNWHIFCRVIDNFGDIGVCWRLAGQLHKEHAIAVTLWVDKLQALQNICPDINSRQAQQIYAGVNVRHWCEPFPICSPGQVVIEAFACELPAAYLALMASSKPLWINLEYLSAETWIKDYHLRQSPVHGLRKTFFFPGFEPETGGLLWDQTQPQLSTEEDLLAAKTKLLTTLGATNSDPATLLVSLFCYRNTALAELLDALSAYHRPVTLIIPQGLISDDVNGWLGQPLELGVSHQRGQLNLVGIPFMDQIEYDHLLATCDLNFVRGEESFVRSQMLGKPFVWHISPQHDDIHLQKLDAFIALFINALAADTGAVISAAHRQWNQPRENASATWCALLDQLPALTRGCQRWRQTQISHGDLASNIVRFSRDHV